MLKRILCLLALGGLGIAAASAQTFNRFNFNVGGGLGGAFGNVGKFTGASYHGVAGGGLNLNSNFGVKAEYMYFDLKFDDGVKRDQSLPGANGNLQAATLNLVYTHAFEGSKLDLGVLSHLLNEAEYGPRTSAFSAIGEGLTFGFGLALGATHRPRRKEEPALPQ